MQRAHSDHRLLDWMIGMTRLHTSTVLLLVVLFLHHTWLGAAQQMMPFPGQGQEPEDPTTVFVSTYIDRLMYIDDKNYEFQALVFVYLSWSDPRARKAVADNAARLKANSSESCKMQCQLYPKDQPDPTQGCCDNVWLPYVSFSTLKYLSQDRVLRSGVNVEPNSDAVAYWNIILGTFMASFDLRAFPFDGQRLHVQMEVPGWAGGNVRLKPSSGGTRMFNTNPDGDALSGWHVKAVRTGTYNLSLCSRYTASSSQPSAPDDPAPLVSDLMYNSKAIKARPGACTAVLDANRDDPAFKVYTRQNLDGSTELQDMPLNVSGVTCTIIIKRYTAQWILSAILPIVASTWLGFVVFLLPRDCMNSRLGAVMTIFVAVAAIQFVVSQDLPNSSYMTALQQLIAAGYMILIMIALESVFIWWLSTYHRTGKRLSEHLAAQKQYEAELKSELHIVKTKLAAMIEEGGGPKKGLASLTGLKSLSMRRSKSKAKIQRYNSGGSTVSASSHSDDAHVRAAAAAVATADASIRKQQLAQQATQAQPGSHPVHWAADVHGEEAGSDVPTRQGPNDQSKEAQLVAEVTQLEQQLAQHKLEEDRLQQQRQQLHADRNRSFGLGSVGQAQGSGSGPDFAGLQQQQQHGLDAGAVHVPAAAGKDMDAVLLNMGAQQHRHEEQEAPVCCAHYRLCTCARVYLAALQNDETLTDQLAHQINKWLALVQFVLYNLAVVLIFAVNHALYHKA